MDEIGVCSGSGGDAFIERVPLAGDGGRSITTDGREKSGLSEGGLGFDGGGVLRGAMRGVAAGTVDAKEVLDLRGEMAGLVGMLLGETGEVPPFLIRHGGRAGGEELGHPGEGSRRIIYPRARRRVEVGGCRNEWVIGGGIAGCKEGAQKGGEGRGHFSKARGGGKREGRKRKAMGRLKKREKGQMGGPIEVRGRMGDGGRDGDEISVGDEVSLEKREGRLGERERKREEDGAVEKDVEGIPINPAISQLSVNPRWGLVTLPKAVLSPLPPPPQKRMFSRFAARGSLIMFLRVLRRMKTNFSVVNRGRHVLQVDPYPSRSRSLCFWGGESPPWFTVVTEYSVGGRWGRLVIIHG